MLDVQLSLLRPTAVYKSLTGEGWEGLLPRSFRKWQKDIKGISYQEPLAKVKLTTFRGYCPSHLSYRFKQTASSMPYTGARKTSYPSQQSVCTAHTPKYAN